MRPARNRQDAVGQLRQLERVGRGEEDGGAGAGDLAQPAVDLGLGADVDAARRVVEQQQLGIGGQPAGDQRLLLVAAGQRGDRLQQRGGAHRQPGDGGKRRAPPRSAAGARRRASATASTLRSTFISGSSPSASRSPGR